jgi:hypothetical protein
MNGIERSQQRSAGEWFKSSRSYGGGECVEVRQEANGDVGVRDSKDPTGPQLTFTRAEWAAFLAGVYAGEFDHVC